MGTIENLDTNVSLLEIFHKTCGTALKVGPHNTRSKDTPCKEKSVGRE